MSWSMRLGIAAPYSKEELYCFWVKFKDDPHEFLLTLWAQIARRQHNSSLTILKAGIGWNIVMSANDRHKQQNKFWRLKS